MVKRCGSDTDTIHTKKQRDGKTRGRTNAPLNRRSTRLRGLIVFRRVLGLVSRCRCVRRWARLSVRRTWPWALSTVWQRRLPSFDDAVSVPFGHGGQKTTGETYPCCSGTSQWQMVHTHKCSALIGIRGIQNSSNHMRDLTRTTEAGEQRE